MSQISQFPYISNDLKLIVPNEFVNIPNTDNPPSHKLTHHTR